ncbi:low molecular weight protein-tyrosine-phosphatase [[Mycoplasma] testudinis]|uniref:low molecular weight protein-tyrosine-phosphatase n=1 Tax=[Mycoplasma] testudinis TaxID=33924 RepID=UPI000485D86E|nr:low molecular weight protein-tyrosine-phosphatase [[Mycoplasma] testudinis]
MCNITFVCLGNICRSPLAEHIFRDLVFKDHSEHLIEIKSAGTADFVRGDPMHYGSTKQLEMNNITYLPRKSQQLSNQIFDWSTFVIVMDNQNYQDVLDKFSSRKDLAKVLKFSQFISELGLTEVADPWYTRDFKKTYDTLLHGCKNLLQFIKKSFI